MGRFAAILFAVLMIAPVAAASWSGYAHKYPEPNTYYDEEEGYMFQEPNQEAEDKIYFNGMTGYHVFGPAPTTTSGDNPGVHQAIRYYAILGYWRDCNNDGFIGNALTGEHVYPAILLPTDSKCGTDSMYVNDQGDGWVTEFIHIGPDANPSTPEDESELYIGVGPEDSRAYVGSTVVTGYGNRAIEDNESLVWGDLGIPDQIPRSTAAVFPLPQGSLSSWEGHADAIDQLTFGQAPEFVNDNGQGIVTYDDVYELGGTLDSLGVPSPIAAVKNLYNGSTGPDDDANEDPNCGGADQPACEGAYAQPLVSVWDCRDHDGDGAIRLPTNLSNVGADPETGEVTAEPADEYWFPPLAPHVNADGSIQGTYYQFFRGFYATEDGCDDEQLALPYDNLERTEETGVGQDLKAETQVTFSFGTTRYLHEMPDGDERRDRTLPVPYTGLIDGFEWAGKSVYMAGWYGSPVYVRLIPNIGNPAANAAEFYRPNAVSFFANVGDDAFSKMGATSETALPAERDNAFRYGSFHCTDFGPNGESDTAWNCDPAAWTTPAKVGDFFDLRDVDCIDYETAGFTTPRLEDANMYDCDTDPRFN